MRVELLSTVVFFLFFILFIGVTGFIIYQIKKINAQIKKANAKLLSEWESLPVLEQYLANHPTSKTDRGFSCYKCNSRSIRNWGQTHANSDRRIFICNHCGEKLYRVEMST